MDAAFLPPIDSSPRALDQRLAQDDRDDGAFDELVTRENETPAKRVARSQPPHRAQHFTQAQAPGATQQSQTTETSVCEESPAAATLGSNEASADNASSSGKDDGPVVCGPAQSPILQQPPQQTPATTPLSTQRGAEVAAATGSKPDIVDGKPSQPKSAAPAIAGVDGNAGAAVRAVAHGHRTEDVVPSSVAATPAPTNTLAAQATQPAPAASASLAPELLAQFGAIETSAPKPAPTSDAPRETGAIDTLANANPLLARLKAGARTPGKPAPMATDSNSNTTAAAASPTPQRTAHAAAAGAPPASDSVSTISNTAAPQAGTVDAARAQSTADSAAAPQANHARAAAPAQQVAQAIVRKFDGGATRFEMRLDPPELGSVTVKLEVQRDHTVTASIAADDASALTQLARASRDIADALQSAGLNLAENGLSFDLNTPSGGSAFAQRDDAPTRSGADLSVVTDDSQPRLARLESWRGARLDVMA